MNGLMQDVRYALRGMRKSPAYAIAVIVTIALGIGPNITAFSVTNALPCAHRTESDPTNLFWSVKLAMVRRSTRCATRTTQTIAM